MLRCLFDTEDEGESAPELYERPCGQDFAVDFAHFCVRTEREDRNLRPPKSRDYLLFRYLNSLLQTLLFSPEFRSAVSMYFVCLLLQY